MSVEDSRTEWTEAAAPFVKVATITIPRQVFTTPAQEAFCEALSFTPWHSLPEHRPLGGVNRVRRVVYESVSEVRHELNGARVGALRRRAVSSRCLRPPPARTIGDRG
ncbi:MAG: hypothetical protein IPG17_27140 [Sandaracinaceae bacterium]|nr:hypothetical protein [Sandaracinaceae bacterium]